MHGTANPHLWNNKHSKRSNVFLIVSLQSQETEKRRRWREATGGWGVWWGGLLCVSRYNRKQMPLLHKTNACTLTELTPGELEGESSGGCWIEWTHTHTHTYILQKLSGFENLSDGALSLLYFHFPPFLSVSLQIYKRMLWETSVRAVVNCSITAQMKHHWSLKLKLRLNYKTINTWSSLMLYELHCDQSWEI